MTKQRMILFGVSAIIFLVAIGGAAGCQTGNSSAESTAGLLGTIGPTSTTSVTLKATTSSASTTTTLAATTTTRLSTTTTEATTTTQGPTTTQAPATTIKATTTTVAQSDSGDTVYITKTGTKYHRGSCSSLSKSKIPISLADAKAAGYEPCKNCDPPR
jgi:hypothetical protein